jgi:type IV pilus assembly protein PilE
MNANIKNPKGMISPDTKKHSRERGVTLIELLITVVIIGILAAVAYPSYTQYVLRSHRTAAKTALHDMAGRQERLFSTTNAYGTTLAALGYPAGASVPIPDANSHYYDLSVNATPTTYILSAARAGTQVNDAECGTFTLDEIGNQGMTGGTGTSQNCWK